MKAALHMTAAAAIYFVIIKSVHHVSLVAFEAALHMMTAATIYFVMILSANHVSLAVKAAL